MRSSRTLSSPSYSRLASSFTQHVAVAIAACLMALVLR
jgi:hypothetical protein